jgi:hypothetical protein
LNSPYYFWFEKLLIILKNKLYNLYHPTNDLTAGNYSCYIIACPPYYFWFENLLIIASSAISSTENWQGSL